MGPFAQGGLARRCQKIIAAAIFVAAVGAFFGTLPWGMNLETNVGLRFFYQLRGPRLPPSEAVIVSMNKRSIDRLGLLSNVERWPRTLHADLIARLTELGAAVIVFDILFKEKRRPETDARLGGAIAASDRTVLLQFLGRDTIDQTAVENESKIVSETLVSPIAEISNGAAGLGPFPLPRVPAKVDQFWAFKNSVGMTPTMPLVALQVWALQSPDITQKITQLLGPAAGSAVTTYLASGRRHADLKKMMNRLRQISRQAPGALAGNYESLGGSADADAPADIDARILRGLIAAYRGEESYFLNFYGPPGTITTIPYDRLLANDLSDTELDLRGKAVFVGVSELTTVDRKEGFYTVFSRDDGIDISGVEIAATALLNLLNGDMIKPLRAPVHVAVIFAFGVIVAFLAVAPRGLWGVLASVAFGAIWLAGAQYIFSKFNLWLPAAIPVLLQIPLAILVGLLVHYGFAQRLSENFARGIRYYVPDSIAQHLALGTAPAVVTEIVEGVCLVTDLSGYTTVSESMTPEALTRFTTQYYDLVGRSVEDYGGEVLRYTGDGMICAWTLTAFDSETDMHRNACLAALGIIEAIDRANQENPTHPLSLRIGLHAGRFALGTVGGGHHYEQSVLGDVINTASRIEGLNKKLRTRVLASGPIAADLEDILVRHLGNFRLVGKSEVVPIFEIIQQTERTTPEQIALCRSFDEMLRAFKSKNWQRTLQKVDQLLSIQPDDGPAMYYRDLCNRYLASPPAASAGAFIAVDEK